MDMREEQKYVCGKRYAITSLAMIDSFWTDRPPILTNYWSGLAINYLPKQGTSWQIFPQFAEAFGYQFADLGIHLRLPMRK